MLDYFEKYNGIDNNIIIRDALVGLKKRINNEDYENPFEEYESVKEDFDSINNWAIKVKDERLANSQMVYKQYFLTFCMLSRFFGSLKDKHYKKSWDILQDCFDQIRIVGKFVDLDKRRELPQLYDLLSSYEELYPYSVFASSEYVIGKSRCSICGKSMQGLECPHIKGNLYWGEFATEIIEEITTLQAVCLVKHPDDKRCVLELGDDKRSELEKFRKLNEFMKLGIPLLCFFTSTSKIEYRTDSTIKKVERNDRCPCGSGLKFKKCCEKKLYYKHEKNLISLGTKIELEV